jgi:tetratricopeptide (TPR) repeat protein
LALVSAQATKIFTVPDFSVPGLEIELIAAENRQRRRRQIQAILTYASAPKPGILFPLQTLVSYAGLSAFVQVAIPDATPTLSPENTRKIAALGLGAPWQFAQDGLGRLWVVNGQPAAEKIADSFVATFVAREHFIFDSPSLNGLLKERAIPISFLGSLHVATEARQVSLCGIVETEMIARIAKSALFAEVAAPDAPDVKDRIIAFFGKVLDTTPESEAFWNGTLKPQILDRFGVNVARESPFRTSAQLSAAIQYHTGIDISKPWPFTVADVKSFRPVARHYVFEIIERLAGPPSNPWQLILDRFLIEADIVLNHRISILLALRTLTFPLSLNLGLLSDVYVKLGNIEKARATADRCFKAERKFTTAHIPAYCAQIAFDYAAIDATVESALRHASASPLLAAETLLAAATAHRANGTLVKALSLAQAAYHSLYDIDHPRARACLLLEGVVLSEMSRPKEAIPQIEQALCGLQAPIPTSHAQFAFAKVLRESGRLEEAIEQANASLSARITAFDYLDPVVIESRFQLAELLQTAQHFHEAQQEFAKMREPFEKAKSALDAAQANSDKAVEQVGRAQEYLSRVGELEKPRAQFDAATAVAEEAAAVLAEVTQTYEKARADFEKASDDLRKHRANYEGTCEHYKVVWHFLRASEDEANASLAFQVVRECTRLSFDICRRRTIDQLRAAKPSVADVKPLFMQLLGVDIFAFVQDLVQKYEKEARSDTFAILATLYLLAFGEGLGQQETDIIALFNNNRAQFHVAPSPRKLSPDRKATPVKARPSPTASPRGGVATPKAVLSPAQTEETS